MGQALLAKLICWTHYVDGDCSFRVLPEGAERAIEVFVEEETLRTVIECWWRDEDFRFNTGDTKYLIVNSRAAGELQIGK